MVSFTDDHTRVATVYFMKHKSGVVDKFSEFHGRLRSGKYDGRMKRYLREHQIHHDITDPHTPEQNGVAERLNRTIIEKARAMVAHAGLHKKYWAEGVNTALYIYNRVASSALRFKMSPYQAWYGRTPDLCHLHVFVCLAYAHVVTHAGSWMTSQRSYDLLVSVMVREAIIC